MPPLTLTWGIYVACGCPGLSGVTGEESGKTAGYALETLQPDDVEELVDIMVGLVGIAAAAGGGAADELVVAAWEALGRLTAAANIGDLASQAAEAVGEPGVDILGLAECVGGEALGEAAEWAFKALTGSPEQPPPGVEAVASCMGWTVDPGSLPPLTTAAAVVLTLNAAFNRYIAERGLVEF